MRLTCPICHRSIEVPASDAPFTIPATRCCNTLVARLVLPSDRRRGLDIVARELTIHSAGLASGRIAGHVFARR
jgi:hypothetical protein